MFVLNEGDVIVEEDQYANLQTSRNLHEQGERECPERLTSPLMSEDQQILLKKSTQLFGSVNTQPGDYTGRQIDMRIKERPTQSDIDNINKAVAVLFNQNLISPIQNPFGYLWQVNCILYSTVIAFLLIKGWKKMRSQNGMGKKRSDKARQVFEEKAKDLRRIIAMAKAELERLKDNRKLTKRGKKKRALLLGECKAITSPDLVNYMEKTKTQLQKLKVQFIRERKKQGGKDFKSSICTRYPTCL